MAAPLVSVVMSVYNGEKFLKKSIESILAQTLTEIELVIINDGSTDDTERIIKSFNDNRVVYVKQTNHGLVYSLNKGLELAKASLIARMDADDVAQPTRLAKQAMFLESNPDHVLVGSNLTFIDEKDRILFESPMLLNDSELRLEMLIRSPFGHPTVMYRKQAVMDAGLYNPKFKSAEDYDLWGRLAKKGKIANINESLLRYRVHGAGVSKTSSQEQTRNSILIKDALWGAKFRLPDIPRFSLARRHYAGSDKTTKIQIGRLADVYRDVFFQSLRRGHLVYAMRIVGATLSPAGLWQLTKSLKRKVLSSHE